MNAMLLLLDTTLNYLALMPAMISEGDTGMIRDLLKDIKIHRRFVFQNLSTEKNTF